MYRLLVSFRMIQDCPLKKPFKKKKNIKRYRQISWFLGIHCHNVCQKKSNTLKLRLSGINKAGSIFIKITAIDQLMEFINSKWVTVRFIINLMKFTVFFIFTLSKSQNLSGIRTFPGSGNVLQPGLRPYQSLIRKS